MNICFVSLGCISKFRGGVDRVTDVLAKSFIEVGHKILMLSLWKEIPGDIVEDYQHFLPSQEIESEENIIFVKKFLIQNQINILIYQSESLLLLKLLVASHGKIPIITVIHTDPLGIIKGIEDIWDMWKYNCGFFRFFLKYPYFILRKKYQLITRRRYLRQKYNFFYKHCAAVVLLSERFKKSFQCISAIENLDKLYAIANPVSFNHPIIPRQKEKIILFVGRLEYSPKRLDRLFYAWKQIKNKSDWKIYVLGDGSERMFYENMANRLNIKDVKFIGSVDPLPYYKRASILCVTSSHEGFSLAILEALQHEIIPIAFDSYEAVHDLIDSSYNGYIVPAFSINEYGEKLELLMNDDNLRNALRNNIRKDNEESKRFEIESIVKSWISLFKRIN